MKVRVRVRAMVRVRVRVRVPDASQQQLSTKALDFLVRFPSTGIGTMKRRPSKERGVWSKAQRKNHTSPSFAAVAMSPEEADTAILVIAAL